MIEMTKSDHPSGNNKMVEYLDYLTLEVFAQDYFYDPELRWGSTGNLIPGISACYPLAEWFLANPRPPQR